MACESSGNRRIFKRIYKIWRIGDNKVINIHTARDKLLEICQENFQIALPWRVFEILRRLYAGVAVRLHGTYFKIR